jgi:cytoskeletal protein CcmA (bactofilin family)
MFGRKSPTAVGPRTTLRGTLTCGEDNLVVAGVFEGTITSEAAVTVVEGGLVVGDIDARVVIVGGRVEGTVVARDRLMMRPHGRIEGDARYGSLEVERGGVIEGRASPLDQPEPIIVEGAKLSPVEETMRFASFSAQSVDDDAREDPDESHEPTEHQGLVGDLEPGEAVERKTTPITAPTRGARSPGPRTTDTWGLRSDPSEIKPTE